MQASQPMDRLLVGDVGFGKTEVAMRAAFKAVNDHKQVVVLSSDDGFSATALYEFLRNDSKILQLILMY